MMEAICEQAVRDLLDLLAIPGPSTEEAAVADHIERAMREMGVPPENILRDRVHEVSEFGGQCGNLVVRFPAVGNHPGPARLFTTHLDTVAIAAGCKPRLEASSGRDQPDRVVNDAPGRALGGDDRAGCAVLLQIARALSGPLAGRDRPATALVFTVQEELGLIGAREIDLSLTGLEGEIHGFNYDGGRIEDLITRVTGTERFNIHVTGIASHAGSKPAEGVSAAVIAARALARLADEGWHGLIERDGRRGSANVGVIEGGQNTNVVMSDLLLRAETRSHDAAFRKQVRRAYEQAFTEAATRTVNRVGQGGGVTFSTGPCYESFALADDAPVVRAAMRAAGRCGIDLQPISDDGGMDANWYNARGIPTVTLGLGLRQVHTPDEWIDLNDFRAACRLTWELLQE